MPKKPTSNRLDDLFDGMQDESAKPEKKSVKKTTVRPAEKKPLASLPAKPATRASTPVQTRALPPLEAVSVAQHGGSGNPSSMSLAFQMDSRNWATLQVVDETAAREWDSDEQLLVKQVVDQLSQALENARLFQEIRSRAEELTVLNEMGSKLASLLSIEAIAEAIYTYASRLMDTTNLFVSLFDETKQEITPIFVINNRERIQVPPRKMGKGLTDHILQTRETLFMPEDVPGHMKKLGLEVITLGNNRPSQCWLGVPLLAGNSALGVIGLQSTDTPNLFNEHHRDLLTTIASQASIAIQNAHLFAETQTRTRELDALNELNQKLSAQLNVNQVLYEIYNGVKHLIDAKNFYVALYSPEKNELSFPLNVSESVIDRSIVTIPADRGLTGYVLRTRKPLLIPENVSEVQQKLGIDMVGEPAKCWLGVPLLLGDQILGVMAAQSYTEPNTYDEHDRDLLMAVAGQAAISIQNTRLFGETQRSEADLRALFTAMTDVIIVYDREGRYIRIAPTNPSRLFRPPDEMLGKKVTEVLPASLHQPFLEIIQRALDGGQLERIEYPLTLEEKQYWFEANVSKLTEDQVFWVAHDITNRKKAEEELQKFKLGIDQSTDAVFITDTNGIITYANPGFEKVYGFSQMEAVGQNPRIIQSGLMTKENYQQFWDTLLSKQTLSGEIVNKSKDGKLVYIAGTNSPIMDENGNILGFLAVHHNITERKQSEDAMRLQSTALETAANTVVLAKTDGTITWVNPAFTEQTGYTFDEAIGKTPRLFKSGLHDQSFYKNMWETILSGNAWQGEVTNLHKNGELFTVQQTITPVTDASGKITHFASIWQDVTASKLYEKTLQRRNEYLSATAEIGRLVTSTLDMPTLFSRTVNLVRDRFGFYHAGIFVTEETGFRAILQAATGEAGAEMLRQKHSLQVGSKSVVGGVTESGQAVIVNDTAASESHKFNPLLPETRAEAAIPLRVGVRTIGALDIQSTTPNAFSENDIAVLQTLADQVAIAIDNARSYELSMQAVKEMREADRLKSQFLANMSHELRTPLNSIIGFSRVILKGIDGPTTDLQQQDLLAIHNSGQHLLGLINDILDLSRIEAGKMELTFDEVNLTELIASVMSTVTGLIKDKSITLHRDLPADLPTVRADAMRIRQVLLNLLANAAKFTDEGSITVHARVKDSPSGHPEITISVTDTGPGISQEDQKKLFQPFSQVDASPTRKSGGSGLGLSISNHLIQMHGGRIGVESMPDQGSVFFFTLPAFRGKSDHDTSPGNRTILAIDDDPQVISLYERYLQPQGYQVVSLSDPSRAVERVRQLKPFAVTLDIMMPGYDGWRVLNDLKSNPETRNIPVIVCSIVEEQEKGFNLGATDYLVKPILEDDMLNVLDRLNIDGSIREVLIVDDNPDDLRLIGRMLSENGRYRPILAEGGRNGWQAIQARAPHAVIIDLLMPEMDGFTILEKMQAENRLRDIPVIVVSGGDLTTEQKQILDEFGHRMIQKSALTEQQLLTTLERALKRVK
jgi:PAS domain S-box-containing protein